MTSSLPFDPTITKYNGRTPDSADLEGTDIEGAEFLFPDMDYSQTPPQRRSAEMCRIKCIRWTNAAVSAAPKRLVTFESGYLGKRCAGFATADFAGPAFPIHEGAPSAIVRYDMTYIVTEGPALVSMPLSEIRDVAFGDIIVALTAVTSGATTSGRISSFNTAGTFTVTQTTDGTAFQVLNNRIGRAMSAKSSSSTGGDILVRIANQW